MVEENRILRTLRRLIKIYEQLSGSQVEETLQSLKDIRRAYILQQDQAIRDSQDIGTVSSGA